MDFQSQIVGSGLADHCLGGCDPESVSDCGFLIDGAGRVAVAGASEVVDDDAVVGVSGCSGISLDGRADRFDGQPEAGAIRALDGVANGDLVWGYVLCAHPRIVA